MAFVCMRCCRCCHSGWSSGTNVAVIFTRTSGTFLGGFNPRTPATLLQEDPETLTGSASCTCDFVLLVTADSLTQRWEQLYCLKAVVSSWWVCCDEIRMISRRLEVLRSERLRPSTQATADFYFLKAIYKTTVKVNKAEIKVRDKHVYF